MQALALALSLVWQRMRVFVQTGGTVLDRQGNVYTLDDLRRILGG
jgi:hypothetical protein